ncbi:MAG: thioredoxin [Gammaproteobacteria bacterium]|nr:MAG: thioredoxin [Gammaproteobacteria bacterium]
MHHSVRLLGIVLLLLPLLALAKREAPLEEGYVNPGQIEHPEWFKNSFLDLREDVAEAAEAGKRVMLYFYQDGCPYCKKLMEDNFHQQDIIETTRKNLDAIAINMWGDREVTALDGRQMTEKEFARQMRVQFTPTLLFLDEQGNEVLRINGYYPPHKFRVALDYVSGHHEKEGPYRAWLARVAPEPATGKLHVEPGFLKPPYRFQDILRFGKPLLVIFEQKQCKACDELHLDYFRRPETRALLDKFNVAVLDSWSDTPLITPDGRRMKAKDWANELDIKYTPSMVFFDKSGQEVFRTEGYLRPFHVQSALDYVASGAYREQPEFQRFIEGRADALREQGIEVDLWK